MKTACFSKRALPLAALALLLGVLMLAGCATQASPDPKAVADADFERSADRPPTSKTLYTMARILIGQGREEEAQYVLVRIIRQEPTYVPAYVSIADIQLRSKKVDEAQKTLLTGLGKAPNDPVLLNNLGMCQVARGDYEGALVYFNRAVQADPRTQRYGANRAMALGMLGRYEESLRAYETVLSPADCHFNLGVLCEERGDTVRAAAEFAQAEELRAQEKKGGSEGSRKEAKPSMPAPANPDGQAAAPVQGAAGAAEKPQ